MINNINKDGFINDYDLDGAISDLIKLTRACEKAGLDVAHMIALLKRTDKKVALKEINEVVAKQKEERTHQILEKMAKEQNDTMSSKYNFSDLLD